MLVMTLLVRDEEDILRANLDYHLEMGVDHFIITDNLSVDATPDIIADYARLGCVTPIHETDDTYAQSAWVTRMAHRAADELNARWVINSDADEFWWPQAAPNLKQQFRRFPGRNIVKAQRSDFICIEGETDPFWNRMVYRKTLTTNAIGKPLAPKCAHRGSTKVTVSQGNHRVNGFAWPRTANSGVEIFHFPIRSRAQFINKIQKGGQAYENNTSLPKTVGKTWRAQYTELKETGKIMFLEENIYSEQSLHEALSAGEVIIDHRLRDYLASKVKVGT